MSTKTALKFWIVCLALSSAIFGAFLYQNDWFAAGLMLVCMILAAHPIFDFRENAADTKNESEGDDE